MKIDRQKLFELYMKKVEEIAEECDWKTHFGPEEIVSLIAGLIEATPSLVQED